MDFDVTGLESISKVRAEDFDRSTENITNPVPVLYQSGYLTIKDYNPLFRTYTLGYPNEEVRNGFVESLIPSYVHRDTLTSNVFAVTIYEYLLNNDIDSCMEKMKSFFASIPYDLKNKTENDFQTIFYLVFRLMGFYTDVEVKSASGRADLVVYSPASIFVFEFKVDGTPEEALAQINSKNYAIPYVSDGRKVVKIGVNFDSATRTIGEWKVEE
jgi:hypothetical protein